MYILKKKLISSTIFRVQWYNFIYIYKIYFDNNIYFLDNKMNFLSISQDGLAEQLRMAEQQQQQSLYRPSAINKDGCCVELPKDGKEFQKKKQPEQRSK